MKYLYYIFLAIRPKTLPVSIFPVLTCFFYIFQKFNLMHFPLFFSCLLTSLFAQISTNLFNDAFDGKNKLDTDLRKGEKRMVSQGLLSFKMVLSLSFIFLFLTAISGIYVIYKGGFFFFILGLLILILCALYSYSNYSLARLALGDLFVILFFGPVISLSISYLMLDEFLVSLAILGLQSGLLINVLLLINNIRDYEEDKKTNKKTLVVRLGKKFGKKMIYCLYFSCFVLHFYWLKESLFIFVFPLISLYFIYFLLKDLNKETLYNRLLFQASKTYIIFCSLMMGSFLLI